MPTLEFIVSVDTANGVAALKNFDGAVNDSGNSAKKSSEQFKIAGLSLTDMNSAVALAKQGLDTLKQVWEFGKQGAENERIAQSFASTAASVGVSAEAMSAALDRAAKGTVDDEAYMMAATRNMALGVATSVQDNVAIMEMARASALKFGGDTETAFTGISEAIGNLQTRQLKQYGLVIDAKKVNEEYAVAIGKTVDQLTEAEQREALRNEVLKKSKELVGEAGNAELTRAEKMKRFEIQLANVEDQAKEYVVDGLMPLLDRGAAVNVLADESATAQDRLAAAYALADGKIGGRNGIYDDLILRYQEEVRLQELATSGAYGQAGALDESSRAAQRAAEAQQIASRASEMQSQAIRETQRDLAALQIEYDNVIALGFEPWSEQATIVKKRMDELNVSLGDNSAEINTLKTQIQTAIDQGFEPGSIQVSTLTTRLSELESQQRATFGVMEISLPITAQMEDAFLSATAAIGPYEDSIYGAAGAIKEFNAQTIFNIASQGLSAEAAYKLGESMGLIQQGADEATRALDAAKQTFQQTGDLKKYESDVRAIQDALNGLQDKHITVTLTTINEEITRQRKEQASEETGGRHSPAAPENQRALGGPVDEGWWYLHDDEYVLSKAMREGRQAIPAEAAPLRQVVGANVSYGGDTVIINDQAALGMYLNAKRLDQLQQIAGILG